ncbi:MAG: FkbM family methyltransferase [Streptosporangiaceae bacterium]
MPPLRHTAAVATDLACRAVGRHTVVRAARFVLRRARLDVPNDLATNGEACLQRQILELSSPGQDIHVVDVGANVGRWSRMMLAAARQAGRLDDLDLHSFEPSSYTFSCLAQALVGQSVVLNHCALGDQPGFATLHVVAPGAGRNSLHRLAGAASCDETEQVSTVTLDEYASRAGLAHLALVKIDTEGHDLVVLRGARTLLAEQRIHVVQFEYNYRWVDARCFLRDAFELFGPYGYRLGKLTPFGVEFYPCWDPELETFVEGNYVACPDPVMRELPTVTWWKSGARGQSAWPASSRPSGWPRPPQGLAWSGPRRDSARRAIREKS